MTVSSSGIDCLLHDHADGADPIGERLPFLFDKNGKEIPQGVDLREFVRAKFLDPHSDIIEAFSNTTGLLQSEETIFEAAKNHAIVRAKQGILYDEFMLAPQYHLFGEFAKEAETDPVMAIRRVINAVVLGIKAAEEIYPNCEFDLISAIGRELPPEKAIQVLKAIEKSDRNYVVGTNIVCDESAFPPELHAETFEYADGAEINFEFHASEWVRRADQEPDFKRDLPFLIRNLRTVVELYKKSGSKTKKRIGHGIALPYVPDLMEEVRDLGIGVTGCPHSNLFGKNVPDLGTLKIRDILRAHVMWSMNPDDDFFHAPIEEVYQMCDEVYRFTPGEKHLMRVNAWLTRFGNRKPIPAEIILSIL